MGREKCWSCHKLKNDVTLRSTDDRMCEQCYQKNEEALAALRKGDNTGCAECVKVNDQPMLQCVICLSNYHGQCAGLKSDVCDTVLSVAREVGWVCKQCREAARLVISQFKSMQTEYDQLKSTTSALEKDVNKLKKELGTLQSSFKPAQLTGDIGQMKSELQAVKVEIAAVKPVKWPSDDPAKTMRTMVHSELADKERRRKNIVVHGLSPVDGIDDVAVFTDLCATHFTVKPAVVRERCRRLRSRAGTIPPLLIVLDREQSAQELLKQSGSLRTVNSSVYLNPDLTPAERQLAFEQRQKRRQRKQQEQRQQQEENESLSGQQGTPQLSANATPFVPPCV